MQVNLIALAIPAFFGLIGVEYWIARRRGKHYYRFNDAIADLNCGVSSQVVGLFMKGALAAMYLWVLERFAFVRYEPGSLVPWLLGFFGVDLAYYWWHRASHRVNFIWAAHVVHHQSQDYNLAVALRQAWFTGITVTLFNLPLALLGVPLEIFLVHSAISLLYQFWIHTRVIGKLGWLELVFNTPSHHRVHHGINPKYIDRNYGGILIIWDRLFGTFQEEQEEVFYGTVKPFESWNPVWANFEQLARIGREARSFSRLGDRLRIWFMPPEWRPVEQGGNVTVPEVDPARFVKWDVPVPKGLHGYVAFQFATGVGLATAMLFFEATWAMSTLAGLAAFVVASTATLGGLYERKAWAFWGEAFRIGAHPLVAWTLVLELGLSRSDLGWGTLCAGIALMVLSAVWLFRFRADFSPGAPLAGEQT